MCMQTTVSSKRKSAATLVRWRVAATMRSYSAFLPLPLGRATTRVVGHPTGDGTDARHRMPRRVVPCAQAPQLPRGFGKGRPANGGTDGKGKKDGAEVGFVGSAEMGISFTCGVCDTRIVKSIKRKSYEEGVCLVKCPGCEKHHVIADNLGMYTSLTGKGSTNIEELAREKGENFTRVTSDVFDLEKLVSKPAKGDDEGLGNKDGNE